MATLQDQSGAMIWWNANLNVVYGNVARPVRGDDLAERQLEWETLNGWLHIEKLRFYVTMHVDDMVTQSEEITA